MVKCPVVVDISIRWGWGWWCVGQWRKKESRDPTRQARTGNSPRTWPPNGHLNARPATVLVAVNRILPSVCLASLLFQDQPLLIGGGGGRIDNQTFPKISERTLWTLGAAGGLLAARPGGVGARESRLGSVRDTRPPASTAARSRCAFRALSVPSDRNRSPRGEFARLLSWQERLGRGGGGARTVGRDP